jgi:hypothetical protein
MSIQLVEGPLGFPLSDKQARNLDAVFNALPKSKEFEYRKTVFLKAPTELNPGERSDVSWISTETPDRYDHVVFARGMNDSQFALNPIVTLNHDHTRPPIGQTPGRVKPTPTLLAQETESAAAATAAVHHHPAGNSTQPIGQRAFQGSPK